MPSTMMHQRAVEHEVDIGAEVGKLREELRQLVAFGHGGQHGGHVLRR